MKSKMLERFVGPELTATEHVGRQLGDQLRELPRGQQYRTLKKLRKETAMSPELSHTPIAEDVVAGVNR